MSRNSADLMLSHLTNLQDALGDLAGSQRQQAVDRAAGWLSEKLTEGSALRGLMDEQNVEWGEVLDRFLHEAGDSPLRGAELREAAWEQWKQGLGEFVTEARLQIEPQAEQLLYAATGAERQILPSFNLGFTSALQWSRLAVRALRLQAPAPPLWALVPALVALGFGRRLTNDWLAQLPGRREAEGSQSDLAQMQEWTSRIKTPGSSAPTSGGATLLIPFPESELCEPWLPVEGEAVLVIPPAEIAELLHSFGSELTTDDLRCWARSTAQTLEIRSCVVELPADAAAVREAANQHPVDWLLGHSDLQGVYPREFEALKSWSEGHFFYLAPPGQEAPTSLSYPVITRADDLQEVIARTRQIS